MPTVKKVDDTGSGDPARSLPVTLGPHQTPHATSTASIVNKSGPEGPAMASPDIQGSSGSGGLFSGARDFIIENSIITQINGEDKIRYIMELLLKYVLVGAAHDDSSRQHPPRCHPGTREAILRGLLDWFNNLPRGERLFLLSGPAGVGKSAIMQTFAESAEHRVVSVFVSRPNNLNDPSRIFPTMAYQLADHIEAYRNYIVDRIATSPGILNKNMETQFRVFFTEPFVEKKIGVGGPPWAILLDGLDEVEGVDAQRDIIRLISAFTQDRHLDTPLAWIIASRPEFHITRTFEEASIYGRFESYSLSIDAEDAREDVGRFLVDSFDTIRRDFPSPLPRNWPGEAVLAKLAAASSGLFIFAQTAIRFIKGPGNSDPISRLDLVLSAINRSKGPPNAEQPFKILDNLYTDILKRIPADSLPTTKLLLSLALSFRSGRFLRLRRDSASRTLRGMSLILQLEPHKVYPALTECISTLRIPPWEEAHKEPLTFLHASFADYLTDARRAGEFYIDVTGIENDVLLGYLHLWHKHFGENSGSRINMLDEYSHGMEETVADEIKAFTRSIFEDMGRTLLTQMVENHKVHRGVSSGSQQKYLEYLNSLRKVNMISLCNSHHGPLTQQNAPTILFISVKRVFDSWKEFKHELCNSGMFQKVHFKDINFDYNDNGTYMKITVSMAFSNL